MRNYKVFKVSAALLTVISLFPAQAFSQSEVPLRAGTPVDSTGPSGTPTGSGNTPFGSGNSPFGPGVYPIYRMPNSTGTIEERKQSASDHYINSRLLLLRALEEFEEGRKYASPEMFVDSEEWRSAIIARATDLNRVVDPKPRVSRSGTRFKENPSLMKRKAERLPKSDDSAKDHNMYGEEKWEQEQQEKRDRGEIPAKKKKQKTAAKKFAPKPSKVAKAKAAAQTKKAAAPVDEQAADKQLNDAIEQVLQERLKQLSNEETKAPATTK